MPPERRPYPLFHRCDSLSTSSQPYSISSPISTGSNSEISSSASTSNQTTTTTTSFIWDHGNRRDNHWQCNHYGKQYKSGHGTSTARIHLKDAFRVEEDQSVSRNQARIDQYVCVSQ